MNERLLRVQARRAADSKKKVSKKKASKRKAPDVIPESSRPKRITKKRS
jgi:hypothetical protein